MSKSRIAIFGYGKVGSTLATAFIGAGHEVVFAINPNRPTGVAEAISANPALSSAQTASAVEAVTGANFVVLAVPFNTVGPLLTPIADRLGGLTVIDATNPVGPGLVHGVGTSSGAEVIARMVPKASVVKCFNIYGAENLGGVQTPVGAPVPLMALAGEDRGAKAAVQELLVTLGWSPLDVGPLSAALDLEHWALLWIRMVRGGGRDGHLVWSAIEWGSDQTR